MWKKSLFNAFRNKDKKIAYYKVDGPNGKLTFVQIPFYENDKFDGVVEFIVEDALD